MNLHEYFCSITEHNRVTETTQNSIDTSNIDRHRTAENQAKVFMVRDWLACYADHLLSRLVVCDDVSQ